MLKMNPTLALEHQAALHKWHSSKHGMVFWEGWYKRRREAGYPLQSKGGCGATRALREAQTLRGAETFFVSEEMTMVAVHAARSMPDQPVLRTDAPFRTGFVVFEVPILLRDINGIVCSTAAFSWVCEDQVPIVKANGEPEGCVDCISITSYSDWYDDRDEYIKDIKTGREPIRDFPVRFLLLSETLMIPGQRLMDKEKVAERHGVTMDVLEDSTLFSEKLPLTLWALMNQRLPLETLQQAERHTRRRLGREGSPLAERRIRVITLRRPTVRHADATGGHVDWTHRWMVSGHWRNVWHPSLRVHRLQWIAPFVKGPDDKPLVVKDTVRQLVR